VTAAVKLGFQASDLPRCISGFGLSGVCPRCGAGNNTLGLPLHLLGMLKFRRYGRFRGRLGFGDGSAGPFLGCGETLILGPLAAI